MNFILCKADNKEDGESLHIGESYLRDLLILCYNYVRNFYELFTKLVYIFFLNNEKADS